MLSLGSALGRALVVRRPAFRRDHRRRSTRTVSQPCTSSWPFAIVRLHPGCDPGILSPPPPQPQPIRAPDDVKHGRSGKPGADGENGEDEKEDSLRNVTATIPSRKRHEHDQVSGNDHGRPDRPRKPHTLVIREAPRERARSTPVATRSARQRRTAHYSKTRECRSKTTALFSADGGPLVHRRRSRRRSAPTSPPVDP